MGLSADAYARMLAGLLPQGKLWRLTPPPPSGIVGVTRDGWNLNYYPANASELTALLAAAALPAGNPSSVWNMQEPSGNVADAIGSVTLTSNLTLYQQAVPGLIRKCIRGVDGTAGQKLINSTTAPNPSLRSTLLLAFLDLPAVPPAVRDVMAVANNADVRYNATGKLRLVAGAAADLVNVPGASRRWIALRTNITAGTSTLFTDQEKFVGTYVLPTSATLVVFGGQAAAIAGIGYAYAAQFTDAAAERSDAQVKTLLQTLGAVISWT